MLILFCDRNTGEAGQQCEIFLLLFWWVTQSVHSYPLIPRIALPFGQPPVARSAQLVFAIGGVPEARSVVEPLRE